MSHAATIYELYYTSSNNLQIASISTFIYDPPTNLCTYYISLQQPAEQPFTQRFPTRNYNGVLCFERENGVCDDYMKRFDRSNRILRMVRRYRPSTKERDIVRRPRSTSYHGHLRQAKKGSMMDEMRHAKQARLATNRDTPRSNGGAHGNNDPRRSDKRPRRTSRSAYSSDYGLDHGGEKHRRLHISDPRP